MLKPKSVKSAKRSVKTESGSTKARKHKRKTLKHTIEEIKLKNGARGLLIDVPGATVMSSQFQFRAGNRYAKDKSIEQVAHIMEHMAFGANARFKDEHAFEADFTKNGA